MKWQAISTRLKTVTDSRYRGFFLQRMETDVTAREAKAKRLAQRLPQPSSQEADASSTAAQALARDGYAMLEPLLTPQRLAELRAYFDAQPCKDPYRSLPAFVGPHNAPPGTHVAFFDNDAITRAPYAFEIANDPRVLGPVSAMFGAKPTISYMTAWWSVPAGDGKAQHAERYHRDVDDMKFVKLFIYLTDVDKTAGPHRFMRGSHVINKLTQIRRYEDAEVHAAFGAENEIEFTGKAGTCFLENTYGLHRGYPPISTPRLIFQVLYSLRPTIYGPKRPIAKIGADTIPGGLDPYVNRVYLAA